MKSFLFKLPIKHNQWTFDIKDNSHEIIPFQTSNKKKTQWTFDIKDNSHEIIPFQTSNKKKKTVDLWY